MPRDGSNVYHIPAGTEGTPDTTVESAKYNTFIYDVETDLNAPRPIVAGGTGATTADNALTALKAEKSGQVVTNYDTHAFVSGSFVSASSATAPPVSGHAFTGIAYITDSANMVIEARDNADGMLYIRRKVSNVWGSFSLDPSSLPITGGTITGTPGTVGIGSASHGGSTGVNFRVSKPLTGNVTGNNIISDAQAQSDVTAAWRGYVTIASTQAASFTLGTVQHYYATQGTFGAGSTVSSQIGFHAHSGLIGAAANYGFFGDIPAAASRWNFYGQGTARNYFKGQMSIGAPTDPGTDGLWVEGNVICNGANAILPPPQIGITNHSLNVTASAGALTISLRDAAGSTPSATSPVIARFRNNAASGNSTTSILSVTSALSLVVSSGSTLGTSNATAFRLWVVLFNDAGTPRLGVINCAGAGAVVSLDERLLMSSTAEGGAGAADNAFTIYTGTAVSSGSFVIVGSIEWNASGVATAGTWTTTNLSYVQAFGPGMKKPGDTVKVISASNLAGQAALTNTSMATISNTGIAITPTSAANYIAYNFTANARIANVAAVNTFVDVAAARGTTQIGSQIQCTSPSSGGGIGWYGGVNFCGVDAPNSISSQTYQLRAFMTGAGANFSIINVSGYVMEIQT